MPNQQKITCDACNHDLTYTGNSIDYRLHLISECIPIHPKVFAVTDMMISPPIADAAYFCGLNCLKKWIGESNESN